MNILLSADHPNFAESLKAARKEKKLSQYDLSVAVGVHERTIVAWESGEQRPTENNWKLLESVLWSTSPAPIQSIPLEEMLAEIDRRGYDFTLSIKKTR